MTTEVELKVLLSPIHLHKAEDFFCAIEQSEYQGEHQLSNRYFDTPDLQLRQLKMGLRIRTSDAFTEQTIKTAGSVIGGLHSRPEYNVSLENDVDQPQLALFPKTIWPKTANTAALNSELTCIFETNFNRKTWHVTYQKSVIEVVLDVGYIRSDLIANSRQEPIHEIEFELVSGAAEHLISLAKKLAKVIPIRLGKASKAQRGYQLAGKSKPLLLEPLTFISHPEKSATTAVFANVIETALERWHLLEQLAQEHLNQPAKCCNFLYRLRSCIRLLSIIFKSLPSEQHKFDSSLDTLETQLGFIDDIQPILDTIKDPFEHDNPIDRELIIVRAQAQLEKFSLSNAINRLLLCKSYGYLQLCCLELVLLCKKKDLDNTLDPIISRLQNTTWQDLVSHIDKSDYNAQQYLQLGHTLENAILIGLAFGELYPHADRDKFRAPWLDLSKGIRLLSYYCQLQTTREQLHLKADAQLNSKQSTLLMAMEHTRLSARKVKPYWN
ncbi:MAG: inorganic triphosphatase [Parashewanella sp.]